MIEKVRELWKVQLEEESILSVLFYDFYDVAMDSLGGSE